jgi:hypothetical protein
MGWESPEECKWCCLPNPKCSYWPGHGCVCVCVAMWMTVHAPSTQLHGRDLDRHTCSPMKSMCFSPFHSASMASRSAEKLDARSSSSRASNTPAFSPRSP